LKATPPFLNPSHRPPISRLRSTLGPVARNTEHLHVALSVRAATMKWNDVVQLEPIRVID
ncbi:MAG TPA: hypothetical protein VIK69_11800, partial [Methylophilaceae bacterium]